MGGAVCVGVCIVHIHRLASADRLQIRQRHAVRRCLCVNSVADNIHVKVILIHLIQFFHFICEIG